MEKKSSNTHRTRELYAPSTTLNSVNEEAETVKVIKKEYGQKPELIQIETND
jgi:hypothetical protein